MAEPITPRSIPWQDHHPASVAIITSTAHKHLTDPVLLVGGERVSPAQAYEMAKNQGNIHAALAYAKHMVDSNPEGFQSLVEAYRDASPVLVPITAKERTRNGVYHYNAIPDAYATVLSDRTGWPTHGEYTGEYILQNNQAGRTGASPMDRMVRHPTFEGPVSPGNYILVDDHFTNGGTFRAAIEHIETNGGTVVGATAIAGRKGLPGMEPLIPTQRMFNQIRTVVGTEGMSTIHSHFFGSPCSKVDECLFTAGEVRQLKGVAISIEEQQRAQYINLNERVPQGRQMQGLVAGRMETEIDAALERKQQSPPSTTARGIEAVDSDGVGRVTPTEKRGIEDLPGTARERAPTAAAIQAEKPVTHTPLSHATGTVGRAVTRAGVATGIGTLAGTALAVTHINEAQAKGHSTEAIASTVSMMGPWGFATEQVRRLGNDIANAVDAATNLATGGNGTKLGDRTLDPSLPIALAQIPVALGIKAYEAITSTENGEKPPLSADVQTQAQAARPAHTPVSYEKDKDTVSERQTVPHTNPPAPAQVRGG